MLSKEFPPTYLMIKQHSVTGKLYFCKTTRSYDKMLKYTGSGRYWNRHIKKHGKEFVETIWFCLFYDKDECNRIALLLSEQQDIVKSNKWANEKPENGLDGGSIKGRPSKFKGRPTGKKGIKVGPRSLETCINISIANKGQIPWNKGKKGLQVAWNKGIKTGPQSKEQRANTSAAIKGKTKGLPKVKITCMHCNKIIGGQSNFNRYHGNNCKQLGKVKNNEGQ